MNHVEFYFHKFQGGFTKYYTESFVYRNIIGNFLRFISFYLPRLDKMENHSKRRDID